MDDKEKYRQALERAKLAIRECGDNKGRISMIESIFPELSESEDEKIRKKIISALNRDKILTEDEAYDCVTWLEKQKHPINYKEAEKACLEYRKMREDCGIKDPVMLDEIEEAYYNGATSIQKLAWSEDDEQYLLVCKNALRKYEVTDKWDSNIISQWLDEKLKLKEK